MSFLELLEKLLPVELALLAGLFFYLILFFKHVADKFVTLSENQAKYIQERLNVVEKTLGISDKAFDFHKKQIKELEEIATKQQEQLLQAEASRQMAEERLSAAEENYQLVVRQLKLKEEEQAKLQVAQLDMQLNIRREALSRFSHDLLMPIQALYSSVANLLDDIQSNQTPSGLHEEITNIRRQIALVTLTARSAVAASQDPKDMPRPSHSCDLNKLVRETIDLFHDQASSKRIGLRLSAPQGPILVDLAAEDLRVVAFNLLSNAVKYSYVGGKAKERYVDVKLIHENDTVTITVENFGIGIQPDEVHRVFEMGYRGALSMDRNRTGMGIGLSTVRNIVMAAQGDVQIESEPTSGDAYITRVKVSIPEGKSQRNENPVD